MDDLVFATAHELATAIARREVSASDVLDAHLARIARHNPQLNAIVTLDEHAARQHAKSADDATAKGESWGPLHGVPVTIKDALETAGLRTTAGFPPLEGYVPTTDATAVARLRAAGAIVIGKTNLPTMAVGYHCDNPLFGRTHNPWDVACTPGGSSGGAAAAVAAGLSPLDIGSDLGGSVRLPAHYCGVYGLKPTEHRIPGTGHIPPPPNAPRSVRHMGTLGPLARSAADLQLALRLLAGPDNHEWEVPPVPVEPATTPALDELHIAWCDDFGGTPISADTRNTLKALVHTLESHGCHVEQASPSGFDLHTAWQAWGELAMAELGATMADEQKREYLAAFASDPNDPTAASQPRMADATVADYTITLHTRDRLIAAVETFLETWDVWICPVSVGPAVPHHAPGTPVTVDSETVPYLMGGLGYCAPFNLTGHPAVTIPIGHSAEGLPIGCQLIGHRWADTDLLAIAERLAEITGPFQRPPPTDARR